MLEAKKNGKGAEMFNYLQYAVSIENDNTNSTNQEAIQNSIVITVGKSTHYLKVHKYESEVSKEG